jgi:endonuclease YncB( thermonuclease family)
MLQGVDRFKERPFGDHIFSVTLSWFNSVRIALWARRRKQLSPERNTLPGQVVLVKLGKGLQRSNILWYTLLWAPFLFVSIAPVPGVAADLHSYAIIRDDATLKIERRIVRLFGIYTGPICDAVQPVFHCAQHAARALNFKIHGFVHCNEQWKNRDGTVTAICEFRGEDLSAYLIQQGWALAAPYAPFEYHTLEKIARHWGRGVWGYTADPYAYPYRHP